jgi:nitrite reductase/ring-hydroxylating ferredoxin subunit/DMSO/TMAO reductase YedYZ heme-binding membrane subunit
MSVTYVPVQWNPYKYWYDAALALAVGLYLYIFIELSPGVLGYAPPINGQVHNARAFGSCAFFMLSVILMIGPLARLDRRFLPLLYNRRHFGVMTFFVALSHFFFIFNWYFAFSPSDQFEALLFSNISYGAVLGFPFEALGIFALISLAVLAFTSHDFWMSFLTPRIWKALHYLIYPCYLAVVGHITLGVGQDLLNMTFPYIAWALALVIAVLHVLAWRREVASDTQAAAAEWEDVCQIGGIREGFAQIKRLSTGERVAVFRNEGALSAISNACAHQNGPLGEGRIIDGCVTCPWHGFQYRVTDGCSPAPFTEKVPTYRVRLMGQNVQVDPKANPPGTPVEPLPIPEGM